MSIVYLSLGSNLGDRNHFIDCAICEIDKRIGEVTKVSNRYETEPWGFISKNKFINVAVEVKTLLPASEVSDIAHKIEEELGRTRGINSTGYEDRVIDIDLLMFDNIISNNESLTLPHPKMHLREFVLIPLREIAPEIIHPVLGIAIKDIKL